YSSLSLVVSIASVVVAEVVFLHRISCYPPPRQQRQQPFLVTSLNLASALIIPAVVHRNRTVVVFVVVVVVLAIEIDVVVHVRGGVGGVGRARPVLVVIAELGVVAGNE
ncbi:unnamed protein product, partial [Ectocarpus fasciculatus]